MRKVLFLMFLLLLMGLGAAGVKAQVRIGGNGAPNAAAVLDLNADDTNTGVKGLALPRVSLTNISTPLIGTPTVNGMMVYNTGGSLSAGIYFWNGSIWNRIDDAIGNELTDTIAGGGLTKSGSGTANNPWKVGIRTTTADSGLYLYSDGSHVFWSSLNQRISLYPMQELTPQTRPVTSVTSVLDTVLFWPDGSYNRLEYHLNPILGVGDICTFQCGNFYAYDFNWTRTYIQIVSLDGLSKAGAMFRIKCFRLNL